MLTALLAVLLMSLSCTKEGGSRDSLQRAVQIMVSSAGLTKATEDPTPEESAINSIRVYAFVGGVRAGYHHEVFEDDGTDRTFLMDMTVFTAATDLVDVEFFVLANDESMVLDDGQPPLSESYDADGLRNLRFTAFDEDKGLPMYRNETVSLNMQGGEEIHLTFTLERPVAKLAVYAAKYPGVSGELSIKSVSIRKEGTRITNYLFPQDEETLKQVGSRANDRLLTQEGGDGVPADYFDGIPDVNTDRTEPSNYTHIATGYVSEVPDDRLMTVDVVYSMGEGTMLMTGTVTMPVIRRNTIYYVLCLVTAEGHIEIDTYSVNDWMKATEDEEVGELVFDYPTYSYIMYGFDSMTGEALVPPADLEYPVASTGNPFVAYFQMLYPQGAEWRYTTVNAGEGDVTVQVYECDAFGTPAATVQMPVRVQYDTETQHGDTRWYQIRVTPTASTDLSVAKLGITFDPGWISDHVEYLMINGVQGDIFWPGSGKDPNIIEIKIE